MRIYKKGGFQGYIKDGGEIWEILIELGENNFISCESTIQYSYDYYDENDLFQIKPFISDSIFIAFWTKIKYVNKKIKVAIWGSCFTREPFHAIDYFNPDYKKWYEVVYTAFHHTFASAMSKPLNIPIIKHFEGEHYKLHNLYADNEYNKTMLKSLEQLKPDYLIVDLFAEANSSIYDLGDNNYISDSFYLMNQVEFKAIPKVNKITIQDEKRFEIFKSAVLLFKKRISEIIPLDRIILVSCRPAFKKNIEGKVSDWENVNWLKMSCNIWDKCDGYFLEIIPEAKHIDMRDIEGISTDASPLYLSINHLQSFYYKEVLNRINKAVLTDMLGEK